MTAVSVLRSPERHSCEKIPVERINYRSPYAASPLVVNLAGTSSYKSRIMDVLNGSFRGEDPEQPISVLEREYGFNEAPEMEAC